MLWIIAAAGLFVAEAFGGLLYLALPEMDVQTGSLVYNLFYYLLFLAIPVILLLRRPGLFESCRPNPISLFSTIAIVALALVGVIFVSDVSALWSIPLQELGFKTASANFSVPTTHSALLVSLFYVAVLPAVCEEFLFRGVVLSALERGGTRRAILQTAALFAVLHGWLVGLPAHFLLGVIIATLVVCTDSIYAGLIYHTTHNAASVLIQYAINRSSLRETASESSRLIDTIGGLSGVMQLAVEVLLTGAVMWFILRRFIARARFRGIEFMPPHRERPDRKEWALLIFGLILAALLYAADIYSMLR